MDSRRKLNIIVAICLCPVYAHFRSTELTDSDRYIPVTVNIAGKNRIASVAAQLRFIAFIIEKRFCRNCFVRTVNYSRLFFLSALNKLGKRLRNCVKRFYARPRKCSACDKRVILCSVKMFDIIRKHIRHRRNDRLIFSRLPIKCNCRIVKQKLKRKSGAFFFPAFACDNDNIVFAFGNIFRYVEHFISTAENIRTDRIFRAKLTAYVYSEILRAEHINFGF